MVRNYHNKSSIIYILLLDSIFPILVLYFNEYRLTKVMEMIIENIISNFLYHRSDSIKIDYFSKENLNETINKIALFRSKNFPNYFTKISIWNKLVYFIKHCSNLKLVGDLT